MFFFLILYPKQYRVTRRFLWLFSKVGFLLEKKNSTILLANIIIIDSRDMNVGENWQHHVCIYQIITLTTYIFFS